MEFITTIPRNQRSDQQKEEPISQCNDEITISTCLTPYEDVALVPSANFLLYESIGSKKGVETDPND
jgi:hypothetical protein